MSLNHARVKLAGVACVGLRDLPGAFRKGLGQLQRRTLAEPCWESGPQKVKALYATGCALPVEDTQVGRSTWNSV